MKIVFLSNSLTPHQLPLSLEFYKNVDVDFTFIECIKVDRTTLPVGWQQNGKFDFVVSYEELMVNLNYYVDLITDCDVVITGSAPDFFIKKRLKNKKLTFRYSERVYKKKCPWYEIPLRAIKYYIKSGRHKNLYLLCASAYTAADYAKTGTFLNKTFKWGYFPNVKKYDDIQCLISQKKKNSILWVARMIDWKHPEAVIEIAKRLKAADVDFELNLVGSGEIESDMQRLAENYGLCDCVHFLGAMSPEKVRGHMEESEIFLFTSDRNEGWGAVLNESMNSGCAVVASHAIGSVPFLIKDGENGLIYRDGDVDDLYGKVKYLLDNPEKRNVLGENAYKTLCEEWNAENAADKFVGLATDLLNGNDIKGFDNGVCSKAEILKDDWYISN